MRGLTLLAALVAAAVISSAASADPSHNIQSPQTLRCTNNRTVVINPGTVTNRSHEGFVGTNEILVVNYVAFTDATGTFVIVDNPQALHGQTLVTCTGDVGGGTTLTVRGFFTPPS